MAYITSNDNRIYAVTETTYGTVPAVAATNRIPAQKLVVKEQSDKPKRRDKTGSRTFPGLPSALRRYTTFDLVTNMCGWSGGNTEPAYGSLFRAAMGGTARVWAGGTTGAGSTTSSLKFSGAHQLVSGQAVQVAGEMRFVSAVVDSTTVALNAPLAATPATGTTVGPTVTYVLGRDLPSVSIFDFWSPANSVQRVLNGATVDELVVGINGDFHQFGFRGPARGLLDNGTFATGDEGLQAFPAEPTLDSFDLTLVPGHLGQVWLGATPARFYTLTAGELRVQNSVEGREKEFGVKGLRAISAGQRNVSIDFELYAGNDTASKDLHSASRQKSPISAMLQLGEQPGQLFGAYMKSVLPEAPTFEDNETRLRWKFSGCRAQGTSDDELVIAIG